MKKLGVILVLMLAIVSLLAAGCGGDDETTPVPTATPGATGTGAPDATPTGGATATPQATATPSETYEDLPDNYKYAMDISSSNGSSGSYKIWVKSNKWRMEMNLTEATGEEFAVIWLDDGEFSYFYSPLENSAMKSASGEDFAGTAGFGVEFFSESYNDYASESAAKAACAASPDCESVNIVGQETYKGQDTIIYEMVGTEGTIKMWVSKDRAWPVKWEMTAPDGTTQIMEFSEIDLNPNIPDSTFQIPSGVEIIDLPAF